MKQWNRRGQRANDSVLGPSSSVFSHHHASMKSLQVDIAEFIVQRLLDEVSIHAMPRHLLVDNVSSRLARINDAASQRLYEMQEGDNGPFVRSRHVAMEVVMESRPDMFARTTFPRVSRSASQESSPTRMRAGDNNRPTPK